MRHNCFCTSALSLSVVFLFLCVQAKAFNDDPGSALHRAQTLSSLTGPHAQPFHIKLTVSEPANLNSRYRAVIEESWQSSNRWSRTITAPDFKQVLKVEGKQSVEQNTGEYYPLWLRNFVTAAIDPLQNEAFWQQVSARIAITSSTNRHPSTSCARAQFKIGTVSLNNDNFAVICFNVDGTLSSVVSPDYSMEFHDQPPFGKKRIARRLVDNPEPGTTLVGVVDTLEEFSPTNTSPDDSNKVPQNPIGIAHISQDTFSKLAEGQPEIVWPQVHSGNTSGKLSVYVSADLNGHILEVYPLNSDNAGLQDAIRDQLLKWQLKPAIGNGKPVQTEAALTFAFSTKHDGTASAVTPVASTIAPAQGPSEAIRISSAIAQGLLIKSYPPVYPAEATASRTAGSVVMNAIISRNGTVTSLSPISSPDPLLADAAMAAVRQWTYRPYLLNGSPVEVATTITVNFNMR